MPNPAESDTTNEWIELYNPTNHSINLSLWTLSDNKHTDELEPTINHGNHETILEPSHYAIITDKESELYNHYSIPSQTLLLTVDDKSIGNGLGNEKDNIILRNETGHIIDAIEWGEDRPEIQGDPVFSPTEGSSLIRTTSPDTNNTLQDFKPTNTPTPGEKNILTSPGSISITQAPHYIPKAYASESFSYPCSIHITLTNFTSSPYYEMKAAIIANTTRPSVASQTWNHDKWQYSDRYLFNITPDEKGSFSQWVHLRFNTNYKSYKNHISQDPTAFIQIKIREQNHTTTHQQEIKLLDMDSSTTNATPGGYFVSTISPSTLNPQSNQILLLTDTTGAIYSIYPSENNSIDEGFSSVNGFVKHAGPVGSGYYIAQQLPNKTTKILHDNITIKPGRYQVSINITDSEFEIKPKKSITIPFTIQNTGDFNDTYAISIKDLSNGWLASPSNKKTAIRNNDQKTISVTIKPSAIIRHYQKHGQLTISVQSKTDLDSIDIHPVFFELIGPDLTVPVIKTYDTDWNEISSINQGQNLKIKSYCKNMGSKNASNVHIDFFIDSIDADHLIGTKHYDTISRYQKYPSVLLDTTYSTPGNHTIYAIVDRPDTITEIDEHNNQQSITFSLVNTTPNPQEKQIIITEFYYHTHPGILNEYIILSNPTNQTIDLTGFYLTNTPFKNHEKQTLIMFPDNTMIEPFSQCIITQDAKAFAMETGISADFEYRTDSTPSIPQMIGSTSFTMSNAGDIIALKHPYNHTIDLISYGNTTKQNHDHWMEDSIPLGTSGQVFKRKQTGKRYIDTNTFTDFTHQRLFFIGQSDLKPQTFKGTVSFDLFVSPDTSFQSIVQSLNHSQQQIYLNMYEFTNMHLCDQLIKCLHRNVSVTILMEGSPVGGISEEERYLLSRLHQYGASIFFIIQNDSQDIYARYPFNHAKYLVIDNETCIIESSNWAETGIPVHPTFGNREWGVIIHHQSFASYLSAVFLQDCNQSRVDIVCFDQMNMTIPHGYYRDKGIIYGRYEPQFTMTQVTTKATITPVFSPDTSQMLIRQLIQQAQTSICVQQLYIYQHWTNQTNPFVQDLIKKAQEGVSIRIILNYNPFYEETIRRCDQTKAFFEDYGIQVRYIYTNNSPFTNIHNKGVIIDNQTVLISSINWNENSVMHNREVGVIITSSAVAAFYADVFYADWHLYDSSSEDDLDQSKKGGIVLPQNSIYIISVFTLTFVVIARDWRTRKWD